MANQRSAECVVAVGRRCSDSVNHDVDVEPRAVILARDGAFRVVLNNHFLIDSGCPEREEIGSIREERYVMHEPIRNTERVAVRSGCQNGCMRRGRSS